MANRYRYGYVFILHYSLIVVKIQGIKLVVHMEWLWDLKIFSFRQEIRTSTSSMTSVPKPLKFLRPHYGTLKAYYEIMADSDLKVCIVGGHFPLSYHLLYLNQVILSLQKYLADILSVLALTMSAEGERVCLIRTFIVFLLEWYILQTCTCFVFPHIDIFTMHVIIFKYFKIFYYLFVLSIWCAVNPVVA